MAFTVISVIEYDIVDKSLSPNRILLPYQLLKLNRIDILLGIDSLIQIRFLTVNKHFQKGM